jgi:hypothetical protein
MEANNLIPIGQLCMYHNIDGSFISALQEFGLIEIVEVEDNKYVAAAQLREVERLMRLHYELGINVEGLDVIINLQQRISDLRAELITATNRLRLFE